MIGLGYFGSGIIYGRGLSIKAPTSAAAALPRPGDSAVPPGAPKSLSAPDSAGKR
jgi:hypothetical protein